MDERLERVWARWCARQVLHLWEPPDVVVRWLDTGDPELQAAARAATRAATRAARDEAMAAARAAAWDAAWAAASAAARSAAWDEARAAEAAAARSAAWNAARDAAWDAARDAQDEALCLIERLSTLRSLEALRAELYISADRWLVREVWRALEDEIPHQTWVVGLDYCETHMVEVAA